MKTTKKRDTLVSLVMAEAKALKKHATAEEINNLNYLALEPDDTRRCIYGQMTGYCYSARASELILKSCVRVYNPIAGGDNAVTDSKLNGKPTPIKESGLRGFKYHSPIEKFILLNSAEGKTINNSILIDYLKGITKKLVFV